ncbi:MAG: FISUMP domain-containing protein, partial [Bacteroidales bacterium]|nr:FISUMP domain-containing protein [Bacteroidales bacterium]
KLLDFGIAKIRSSITMTQTGSRMGTLMYMSPEQIKDSKHLDYHTDLYSLAVSFVHLLTGEAPYDHTNSSEFEIQMMIVSEPVQTDKLPSDWQSFLLPYLSKEPAQRPSLTSFAHKTTEQAGLPHTPSVSEQKPDNTIVDNGDAHFKTLGSAGSKTINDKYSKQDEATIIEKEDKPIAVEKKYAPAKIQVPPKKKKSYAALWWVTGIVAILLITLFIWQPWNSLPHVNTFSIMNITQNSATLNGYVKTNGVFSISQQGFCYNTSTNPSINDTRITCMNGDGNIYSTLNNLDENSIYYVRAYATNIIGTAYGQEISFKTLRIDTFASSEILNFSNLNHNSASVNCNIIDNGGTEVSERGIYYSINSIPNIAIFPLELMGSWYDDVGGGWNVYITENNGTVTIMNGNEYYKLIFIRKQKSTNNYIIHTIKDNEHFTVFIELNSIDRMRFEKVRGKYEDWTPNNLQGHHKRDASVYRKIASGKGNGSYTVNISDLSENTSYYVRAYAINEIGTTYGDERSFTTTAGTSRGSVSASSGTFTDTRDGKTYRTVRIGTQTWMTENLNYSTGNSWCFNNNSSNCNTYGRLYDWNTARSVCPSGWHLPSKSDFEALLSNVGGSDSNAYHALKDGGSSGFSALFGGWRHHDGHFYYIGYYGYWWSSSERDASNAWNLYMYSSNQDASMSSYSKELGFSVRCLKN